MSLDSSSEDRTRLDSIYTKRNLREATTSIAHHQNAFYNITRTYLGAFHAPDGSKSHVQLIGIARFLCHGLICIACTTKSFLPLILLFKNLLLPALLYFENILKDEHLLDAKVEKMKLANGKYES